MTTKSKKPTTTAQEDITTAGQRRINLIWEWTQAVIAISVVFSTLIVAVVSALRVVTKSPPLEFPPILSNALFLVVGFYFSRTNHAAIGGVGAKPVEKYEGR